MDDIELKEVKMIHVIVLNGLEFRMLPIVLMIAAVQIVAKDYT